MDCTGSLHLFSDNGLTHHQCFRNLTGLNLDEFSDQDNLTPDHLCTNVWILATSLKVTHAVDHIT